MAIRRVVDRILEHPAVYAAWQAPFVSQKFAPVERRLSRTTVRRILDVGCGPGTNARRFAGAEYVGVDINEHYLVIARAKYHGTFVQADLETADLSALGTFDTILVNSFLHHLPDDAVGRILRQLHHRLAPAGTVHFLELVMPEKRSLATVMAKLDRGRYARLLGSWCALFEAHFDAVAIEPYEYGGGLWSMIHFQGKARSCVFL
jgi:SAM-dependent methyltransferase